MIATTLSPCLAALSHDLSARPHGLFAGDVAETVSALEKNHDIRGLLSAVMQANRMRAILQAGLADNTAFRAAFDHADLPLWEADAMEADPAQQRAMGLKLLNLVRSDSAAEVHLTVGPGADGIAQAMIDDLHGRHIPFHLDPYDADFTRLFLSHADADGIAAYAAHRVALFDGVTNDIVAMPNTLPAPRIAGDAEKIGLFNRLMAPYKEKTRSGTVPFTLTYFPTEADAALDGIPLADYLKLYFDMSDQPDHLIGEAHGHLIERLNRTNNVRFTNDDGTDISMSLIDDNGAHFTFCNSLTFRNVPGSEVFSAPRRNSVEGRIVAIGKFSPKGDKGNVIENLTVDFEGGRVVSFAADKGAEHFEAFLARDEGNRYVGELGIGTNPHLKRHVLNGLFVEKVGGSFHLALGSAYTMTDYLGTPVYVDNGNRSADHWDITTMLYGRGGRMFLDGECVMDDGVFLDPALDILNRGWAAVPVEERPEQWKEYAGPFTGGEKRS